MAALLLAALALGRHAPAWGLAVRVVPGLRGLMRPEAYFGAVTLLAAALAARALPDARRRVDVAARVSGAMSVALLLLAGMTFLRGSRLARGVVRPLPVFPPVVHDIVFTATSHAAAWLLAFYAIALLAQHGRLAPARARAWFVGLMILELFINALPLPSWAPSSTLGSPPAMARVLRAGVAAGEVTRVLRDADAYQADDLRGAADVAGTLRPNHGADRGVAHIDPLHTGYDPEALAWRALARHDPLRNLRLHGARYALMPLSVLLRRLPALRPIARYGRSSWALAVDETPAPVAFVAGRVHAVNAPGAARAAAFARGFAPGYDAAIEGGAPRASRGQCALSRRSPVRVALRCVAQSPGYAVLNDRHAPGWRATVNGAPAAILRANGMFRAVAIPAGVSRVEMRYATPRLGAGLTLSALSALALWLWARRRAGPQPDEGA
ncbi:MAG: YfhO family protein [Polyangiales bacterium]